ncbi:MAG: hypothetical protein AAF549_02755 [Pseudomonadota bacterium]
MKAVMAAFLICFSSATSFAQPAFDSSQLLDDLRDDVISAQDAAQQLADASNLSLGDAQTLIGEIDALENINSSFASNLLDGFVDGTSSILPSDIPQITEIINNLDVGTILYESAYDLIDDVMDGAIDLDLAEALSEIDVLGNIDELTDIGAILDSTGVLDALEDLESLLSPEQIAAQLGEILDIAISPELQALFDPDELASQVVGQLETLAPGLVDIVDDVLGEGAAEEIVAALLGGNVTPPTVGVPPGEAGLCTPICTGPCGRCAPHIKNNHIEIRNHVTAEFDNHRNWIVNDWFGEYLQPAMALMAAQISQSGMQQMQILGSFFDAKHQLETQRLLQTMTAEAHMDYHVSEALCEIESSTAHFSNSKRRSDLAKRTLSHRFMQKQVNQRDGVSFVGEISDLPSRTEHFIDTFCDPNSGGQDENGRPGLAAFCEGTSASPEQINADVNFTTTVENNLTLDIDFSDRGLGDLTPDEENVFALAANIIGHQTAPLIPRLKVNFPDGTPRPIMNLYADLRSMFAKRSVAQNSFSAIAGMRAEGSSEAGPFLKAILLEMGVDPIFIEEYLGENPSLFATEEVMMKVAYQDPRFYANLYDKPANVERMNTALLALEIVQDRNIYESLLRSEAVLATLIETKLLKYHREVSGKIDDISLNQRRRGEID